MRDLRIRRLGYALGAEITGVDLTKALDDGVVAAIRTAWFENLVLCFPRQDLTPGQLIAFAGYFGEVDDNRALPNMQDPVNKQILRLENRPSQNGAANRAPWHTDYDHSVRPTTGTFLNAKALPPVGGNTAFANMYMAYDSLSPALQKILDPIEAVHDYSLGHRFMVGNDSAEKRAERMRLFPPIVHRLVRTHPETGRKALMLGNHLRNFVGMTEEETQPFLAFLNEHAVRYEFVYRHVWSLGDLLMWDNRCLLHYAVQDYDQEAVVRRMMRACLVGAKTGYVHADVPSVAIPAPAG